MKKQEYIHGIKKEFADLAWLTTLVHKAKLGCWYSYKILVLINQNDYDDLMIDVNLLV